MSIKSEPYVSVAAKCLYNNGLSNVSFGFVGSLESVATAVIMRTSAYSLSYEVDAITICSPIAQSNEPDV